MGVRRMASSTLIQAVDVEASDIQVKSTPTASKLIGVLDRMVMKLERELVSPSVSDTQLYERLECVRNIDHTTNTQKNSV